MKSIMMKRLSGVMVALAILWGSFLPVHGAEGVRLRWWSAEEKLPFTVENMFPGDSAVKEYTVEISHKRALTLHFCGDVRAGGEKPAGVLMLRVVLPDKGITLYDGPVKDMPDVTHRLGAHEKTINYEITAYLDSSVGNEYMNLGLTVDFRWWYTPESNHPQTGDKAPVAIYGLLLTVSAGAVRILTKKLKESRNETK